MNKHIGLFFGSFNPVHVGHLIIADYMVEHTNMDEVWMVVSPQNPFKEKDGLVPENKRFQMLKLALKGNRRVKASDVEFNLPNPSYTIHTLEHLTKKYPESHFSIIIGSDNLKDLPKWKNAKTLIKQYSFYVYKRSGYQLGKWKDHKNVHLLSAPLLNISGTYIREQIKHEKSIRYLVHDAVLAFIKKNKLYKK